MSTIINQSFSLIDCKRHLPSLFQSQFLLFGLGQTVLVHSHILNECYSFVPAVVQYVPILPPNVVLGFLFLSFNMNLLRSINQIHFTALIWKLRPLLPLLRPLPGLFPYSHLKNTRANDRS